MTTRKMILSIVLSIGALIVAQISAQIIVSGLLVIKIPEFICNAAAGVLYIGICYYLLKLLCKKYIKEDMKELYIPQFKIKAKWLVAALVLPVAVSGIYLLMDGSFSQNNISISEKIVLISAGIFFTGLGAGFVEEMVFRGIIMNSVEKRFNKKIAILAPSLLFGFVHIIGMDFNLLSCLLVLIAGTMVGVMFSLITLDEESVWNSAIVHTIWNIVIIGGILCIGDSVDEYSAYSYVLKTRTFMLTGGQFGIESSVISVAGYGLVALFAYYLTKRKATNLEKNV